MILRRCLALLLIGGSLNLIEAQSDSLTSAPSSIVNPFTQGYKIVPEKPWIGISRQQLYPTSIVGEDSAGKGLVIDLRDSTLFGKIYSGVFYFERNNSDYLYSRYRETSRLIKGRGIIRIADYLGEHSITNVNKWTDEGVIAYRLELWRKKRGDIQSLGFFDSNVHFRYKEKHFQKSLTLTEGPFVNLITSDHPDWLVVSLETDQSSQAWIDVPGLGLFTDGENKIRHEIRVKNLKAGYHYQYRVIASRSSDTLKSPFFPIHTAPPPGSEPVIFAFAGDGREGIGGGEQEYLGVNRYTLQQICSAVFRHGANFLLFNGDLVNGYTDYTKDFILEFKAFKQSLFGFMVQRPVYCSMGNHEALLNAFSDSNQRNLEMDKWPYETHSVEAFFSREFVHPNNGPQAYPDTPPYQENVYSFTYGNVKIIAMNTNYWWTSHRRIKEFGGSPEGYILPNQMDWIRKQLKAADENSAIKYVVLMGHEPIFPNSAHTKDAMWYNGDNTRRAYMAKDGKNLKAFDKGIVEARNEFWKIVSNSPKVVAVLGSDEHTYFRTLITRETPVGLFPKDDLDGNGKLDDGQYSSNPDFGYPLWNIMGGGAGAPYYTQKDTPWKDWVKIFSSHYNYLIFKADSQKISLEVYNLTGQLIDKVDDLLEIKNR